MEFRFRGCEKLDFSTETMMFESQQRKKPFLAINDSQHVGAIKISVG